MCIRDRISKISKVTCCFIWTCICYNCSCFSSYISTTTCTTLLSCIKVVSMISTTTWRVGIIPRRTCVSIRISSWIIIYTSYNYFFLRYKTCWLITSTYSTCIYYWCSTPFSCSVLYTIIIHIGITTTTFIQIRITTCNTCTVFRLCWTADK